MKKLLLFASVLVCLVMFMGAADFRSIPEMLDPFPVKNNCTGYTIIEYEKAITCKGDTVRLIHKSGFAQVTAAP